MRERRNGTALTAVCDTEQRFNDVVAFSAAYVEILTDGKSSSAISARLASTKSKVQFFQAKDAVAFS